MIPSHREHVIALGIWIIVIAALVFGPNLLDRNSLVLCTLCFTAIALVVNIAPRCRAVEPLVLWLMLVAIGGYLLQRVVGIVGQTATSSIGGLSLRESPLFACALWCLTSVVAAEGTSLIVPRSSRWFGVIGGSLLCFAACAIDVLALRLDLWSLRYEMRTVFFYFVGGSVFLSAAKLFSIVPTERSTLTTHIVAAQALCLLLL